jgi:predicted DCC family thiol-disulfide oxidoreductase YuxK
MEHLVEQAVTTQNRRMIVVELISREECHLCDIAKDVVLKARQRHSFELKEIKIKEGDAYFDRYKEQIPVVLINKEVAFVYKVSEQALLKKLQQASA